MVLVGGAGTRLLPLTLTTPKQMLPIVEVAMIERVLAHLASHGVREAVLSMGYRPDAFLASFPEDRCAGVGLTYAVEPAPLDTAGAIRFAALAGKLDDTFVVVNGDVLTDLDVGALVGFHHDCGAEATVSLTAVEDPSSFGVVTTDETGRVQAFVEKPPREDAPSNLINAGTYILEPGVLDRIPPGRRVSIEREVFPALVELGVLYAMPSDGYWIDAGTAAKYLQAHTDLLAGGRGSPPAPGAREGATGVWTLGEPVVDGEVMPRSLVGDAAFVGGGSEVRGSVVGAGARVESATVVDSVLLPGAVLHAGSAVEGSIIGAAAVVREGATVSGLSVVGDGVDVPAGAHLHGQLVPQP
ncbi:MAG: NDP-sugar synthase [Actinomycetota bacterium]|nr:NDP-sugar synthase [Actinomycetota bacterium]